MTAVEPAMPLVLSAAVLLAGGDASGWLLIVAALAVVAIRRWEAYASALPGAAAVASGLAAEGARWHLVLAALALVAGAVLVTRRRVPSDDLDMPRAVIAAVAGLFVIGVGWVPVLDLDRLAAYRDGASLGAAGAALAVVAVHSTAALRARSGKMEDPAEAGGAEPGA